MARINQAKNATSNAFIAAKRRREEQQCAGLQESNPKGDVNFFEEQHHHLLSCLESATVSQTTTAGSESAKGLWKFIHHSLLFFQGSRIYWDWASFDEYQREHSAGSAENSEARRARRKKCEIGEFAQLFNIM